MSVFPLSAIKITVGPLIAALTYYNFPFTIENIVREITFIFIAVGGFKNPVTFTSVVQPISLVNVPVWVNVCAFSISLVVQ
jgi:hypothetical protein